MSALARGPVETWQPGKEAAQAIRAEQINLLYKQAPAALLATLVNAIVLVTVLWSETDAPALSVWMLLVCALTLGRYGLIRAYRLASPGTFEAPRWGRRFVLGVALNGLLWGMAGYAFFVEHSQVHQTLLAFVLAGMTAGAVSTLSSVRRAYLAFLVPALVPYTYRVFSQGSEIHVAMGTMVLLFVAMMWVISARLHATVTESLRLRCKNLDLLIDLMLARDQQQVANRELAAEVEAKHRAQRALEQSYEELERRVEERTQELAHTNERLRTEKELFHVTLTSIGDGVITTDSAGSVTFLNPAAESFTGWSVDEAKGVPLPQVLRIIDEKTRSEEVGSLYQCMTAGHCVLATRPILLIRRDGQELHINPSSAPLFNGQGEVIGAVLTFRDVSEERKLSQQLSYQASHDALTGLVNRREFESRLARVLDSASSQCPHALIFIDLDQFKVVNDTCGHIAGDELLRQFGALMKTRIRATDTLARLGGDEFGVLLERCPREEAVRIANTLCKLAQDFRFGWQDKSFTVGVSIGVLPIMDGHEKNPASALRAADTACYAAKARGRGRVHVYEPDDRMVARRYDEIQWIPRVQQALAEGRLRLYMQPIVSTGATGTNGGLCEILLRLLDERGAIVLPGAFLPAAERYGQMPVIDRWVVGKALEALKARGQDEDPVIFSINLSGQSLGDEDFLDFVLSGIRASRVEPSSLCFEITETAAISDLTHAMRFIDALKEIGCWFSLDDFGSGLSSFGYLKTLPVDYLKIDGRFVKDMMSDSIDQAMVEAIRHLGHVMNMKLIAEWVENAETLEKLTALGIDYVQGYHLAEPRPLPAA